MTSLDTTQKYLLYNSYMGGTKKLASAVRSNKIELDDGPLAARQQWYFTPITGPYYRVRTVANGDSQSLDVINDKGTDSTSVYFAPTAFVTGQLWRLDPWSDGTYRLSNNFTGLDLHLDIYADMLQPYLARDERSGQHWTLSQVDPNASSSSSAVASSTASSTRSTSTAASASGAFDASKGGISTGAIAGIAVGGALVWGLFMAFIIWILRKKKRAAASRSQQTTLYSATSSPEWKTQSAVAPHGFYDKTLVSEQSVEVYAHTQPMPVELATPPVELPAAPPLELASNPR